MDVMWRKDLKDINTIVKCFIIIFFTEPAASASEAVHQEGTLTRKHDWFAEGKRSQSR